MGAPAFRGLLGCCAAFTTLQPPAVHGQALQAAAAAPAYVPPFEHSLDSDLFNQEKAIEYFERKYYNAENLWSLNEQHLQEVASLRQAAFAQPVLALAAAQVLYLFAWFTRSGEILRDNIVAAAQLFERSIVAGPCDKDRPTAEWIARACDIRFGQAALLYTWLADTDRDVSVSHQFRSRSSLVFDYLKEVPRFAGVKASWTSPLHMNFNQLRFPTAPSRPFWDPKLIPLAAFLEENYPIFRAELEAIVNHPGDIYEQLRRADGSVESLATPGGWDAVRIVRYGHWFELFCEVAPRTCELLRSRPELANCPYVNTNYYKLFPGAHLKPHFGNAPRLTAHLPVIAPEPLRAGISVGPERGLWMDGKAMILDDTYPHAVSHWGTKPRYVLATWFCHPCDEDTDHRQTCPTQM